jgi:IS5 family transposase
VWESQLTKWRQKDTDVPWTVNHGEIQYGYKNLLNIDKQHKLIRRYVVTNAAVHDSQFLEAILLQAKAGRDVWADSSYRSAEIDAHLKATVLRSKIHRKGYRNKPLTAHQQAHNRGRSRIRARVEHVFGHQVTAMGDKLIRTVELVRVRLKIELKNLMYNFQRFLLLSAPRKAQGA